VTPPPTRIPTSLIPHSLIPPSLPLPIDTAYFAYLPFSSLQPLPSESTSSIYREGFVEECNKVTYELSKHNGVDICLNHHFYPGMLCSSALFVNQAPKLELTWEIRRIFENSACRQIISLGETTARGGVISLFDGVHVDCFHKKAINPIAWDTCVSERFPLQILTGIDKIDIFFNMMVRSLVDSENTQILNESWFLDILTKTVKIIREWLSNHKTPDLGGFERCSIRDNNIIQSALNNLYNNLLENIDEFEEFCNPIAWDSNDLVLNDKRCTYGRSKDFPPAEERLSLSERLQLFSERNQKQLDNLNAFHGILVGIAAAFLAVAYKALGDLDFISLFPLPLPYPAIAIAISFNFLAAIHSLVSYFPIYRDILMRVLPSARTTNNDIHDFGDYKIQRQYIHEREKFAFLINQCANERDRVILNNMHIIEAGEVVTKAEQIHCRSIQAAISICLYITALLFYAFASLKYGMIWWGIHWWDTLAKIFS